MPSPPTVSAAFSGFVVGVLLTLVLTGVFTSASKTAAVKTTLPPSTPVADSQLVIRIKRIAVHQLGTASVPAGRGPRLLDVTTQPAGPLVVAPDAGVRLAHFRSIFIHFRLNDHPLGKSWRLKAAKADVFTVLKALYTSQLPIYNVEMVGEFPLNGKNKPSEDSVLIAYMDHASAERIPWNRWSRGADEGRLWAALDEHYVDPHFA